MFTHILVPTDGSDLSQATVVRAVKFAKETGARLTFFYAEPVVPGVYAGLGVISDPQAQRTAQERLDSATHDILRSAEQVAQAAGVACECLARRGERPYALIIEAAQTQACDLIFMASHGRRGLDALLLGSETQKVLTHSKIPVLVYR